MNIKKFVMALAVLLLPAVASAQKFALIDMEFVLKNIPAYERANEQLNQVSKKWQAEVDALSTEAQTMYKNYQNEVVFLSQEQKKERQDAIMEKEKAAAELKRKYFGPDGELFKKRARPRQQRRDNLRKPEDRHQQRGAAKAGLLLLTSGRPTANRHRPHGKQAAAGKGRKQQTTTIKTTNKNEKTILGADDVCAFGNLCPEVRSRQFAGHNPGNARIRHGKKRGGRPAKAV